MRPPSYYTSLAYSGSGGNNGSGRPYSSSSQQLRSGLSSSSSSAYVTRTHLPFVSQSMLVAHCITGSGTSTKPYGQTTSSSTLRLPSSYSTSYTSRSPSTKRQPTNSYLSTSSNSSPSTSYLSSRGTTSYLSSSARPFSGASSSSHSSSSYRPSASSTSSSSYYKPIRLRERPLLTQISRQLNSSTSSSKPTLSERTVHSAATSSEAPEAAKQVVPAPAEEQVIEKPPPTTDDQQAADWSSDVGRNISRNKYLIKFREKDHRPSISPQSVTVEPTPGEQQLVEVKSEDQQQVVVESSEEMRLPLAQAEVAEEESKLEALAKEADCDRSGGKAAESEKKKPKAKRNIKLKIKTLNSSNPTSTTSTATTTTSKQVVDEGEQVKVKKDSPEETSSPKPAKVKRLVKISKGKSTESSENEPEKQALSSSKTPKTPKSAKKVLVQKQQEQVEQSSEVKPAPIVDLQKAAALKSEVHSPGSAPVESKRIRFREYNFNDFNFLTVLGHGGWGFVILAELKSYDAYFAVKCIKKITIVEDDDFDSIMIERKMLTLGNIHPFICKLFCTFETDGYLFFVMEYCAGGDLMFHVQKEGKFSESRCRFYAAEIICAIRFLHNRHIIYRDLKLDNILLDSKGHIRLVDFGMCQCRTYREEMLPSNFCGTPEYISPEIIKGVPYNHSVDWWSFGVLLYEMAVGKMPFRGGDENELLWNVCYEQIHYPMFLTKELTSLLQLLLEREPSKRMGMATCKAGDIYDHPWFRGVDWKAMEAMRVEPPFVPEVNSKRDVQNFDADFTESTPELSPVDSATLEKIDQSQFQKFPYTNPDIFNFE